MKSDPIRFCKILLPLFAFVLMFYTIAPSVTLAAVGGEIEVTLETKVDNREGFITEEKINNPNSTNEIVLTLTNNTWAEGIANKTELKEMLIKSMVPNVDKAEWNNYINNPTGNLEITPIGNSQLSIKLPNNIPYTISKNQKIKLNLSPVLIENWPGKVKSVDFTIYAKPQLSIDGSIMTDTKLVDLKNGGKVIKLNLRNAKWNKVAINNKTNLTKILSSFKEPGSTETTWKVMGYVMNKVDPNSVVSLTNDDRTLTIKLPSIAIEPIEGEVIFNPDDISGGSIITRDSEVAGEKLTSIANSFTITDGNSKTPSLEITASPMTEANVVLGDTSTISLKLNGTARWSDLTSAKKELLIDALVAKKQPEQWEIVKNELKKNLGNIQLVGTLNNKLEIKIPRVPNYFLVEDQVISVSVPYQLLKVNSKIGQKNFTITATPKALIKGSVTPTVTPTDIAKGGKTLVVELVNAKWDLDIATNTSKRENLLDGFEFQDSSGMTANAVTTIKTRAKVVRTSDKIVTITLPAVSGFEATGNILVTFNQNKKELKYSTPKLGSVTKEAFTVTLADGGGKNDQVPTVPTVATAALSGGSFTDSQIVQGNGQITLTLSGAQWDTGLSTNKSKKSSLLKGFKVVDQAKEWSVLSSALQLSGEFNVVNSVNGGTLTITLPKVSNYSIIRDQTVSVTIPKSVLVNYKSDIPVQQNLTITVPTGKVGKKSLGELSASEIADAIKKNSKVFVPNKKVVSIFVNTVELSGSAKGKNSITTIEVTTTDDVKEVQLTVAGGTSERMKTANNKSIFVYTGLEKNSELIVSVFGTVKSNPLQADIYKKIASGSKMYNELPKKDYTGYYAVYKLLTDKSILKELLKYYSIDELKIVQ